jgi:hypothetical protein
MYCVVRRVLELILIIVILPLLFSCNSDEKIPGYKLSEILVVTLKVEDKSDIEKILLTTTQGADSLLKEDIAQQLKIKLKAPLKGEGTFSIAVFTAQDTLYLRENYAEGGYRPKLIIENDKIEVKEWF